ncbi:MAG: hypothetical protein JXM79_23335 [Sedimentisphaerales bacterium]|nr:hypothetical protein [Sedimentisphaerales bacterium]
MYYVHDFTVRGCRLEDSRSDGTHFYFCQPGQFNDHFVYRAKMGGYDSSESQRQNRAGG